MEKLSKDIVLELGLVSEVTDGIAEMLYKKFDGNAVKASEGIKESSKGKYVFKAIDVIKYWRDAGIKGDIIC